MKRFGIIFFLYYTYATVLAFAQPQSEEPPMPGFQPLPKHEVRAVWLTTIGGIDWPYNYAQSTLSIRKQQQELRNTLDQLQRIGINTVLLQTRIRATTIYPSVYEPWDGCLSGVPGRSPGYDALQFAINECHRRGMELHAWVVTIPVGKWNGEGCRQLRKRHSNLLKRIGQDGYMNPELQGTADYLADFCAEIVRNYDVDGIHLDYIRYPETWPSRVNKQKGRANITRIVSAVSRRVKVLKPWVKMSCSPIGKHDDLPRQWSHGWNARTTVCQDAQAWLRDGLMDQLYPMMYFRGQNFYPFAADWNESSYGRTVVPGLGIYFLSPRESNWPLNDITREMEFLRGQGMGQAYFRSKFLTDNTKGLYDYSCKWFGLAPSLVPPMTWTGEAAPVSPTLLQRTECAVGNNEGKAYALLSWQHKDSSDTISTHYNIYASRTLPVNINDARNLVATNWRATSIRIPTDPSLHFAITATNRYGLESPPLQEKGAFIESNSKVALSTFTPMPCDGRTLLLPEALSQVDATFLSIENLQGTIVATKPLHGRRIDVRTLPVGHYTVHTLGRKGIVHRLGHFSISPESRGIKTN